MMVSMVIYLPKVRNKQTKNKNICAHSKPKDMEHRQRTVGQIPCDARASPRHLSSKVTFAAVLLAVKNNSQENHYPWDIANRSLSVAIVRFLRKECRLGQQAPPTHQASAAATAQACFFYMILS